MLRFDNQRAGKTVKQSDKRFDVLEGSISSVMKSYEEGLFRNDAEFLSSIAKLYVEYNHRVKTELFRNYTAFVTHVANVKNAVLKALEDQNHVILGEESIDPTGEDQGAFVEADFQSEIVFDTSLISGGEQNFDDQAENHAEQAPEVPMEICPEEISDKRRRVTKPRPGDESTGTPTKRRRRTLLQKMKKKR